MRTKHQKQSPKSPGYFGIGEENLNDNYGNDIPLEIDFKEGFDIRYKIDENGDTSFNFGDNLQEGEFVEINRIIGSNLIEIAKVLLGLISLSIGKDERFLYEKFYSPSSSIYRSLRYPHPRDLGERGYVLGCGEHTDYGFLSILIQDDTGGLHVKDVNGEWYSATPVPGALCVNLGDCLQRITNDAYWATPHRVFLTNAEKDRYSQVIFFDPKKDVLLDPIEGFYSDENPPKYEIITYGEHLTNRTNSTYTMMKK